jgi:hypothetical protein
MALYRRLRSVVRSTTDRHTTASPSRRAVVVPAWFSSSPLGRWTAAYRHVVAANESSAAAVILPDGPKPQHHQVNAFLGDKLLNAAAARVLLCSDLSVALLGTTTTTEDDDDDTDPDQPPGENQQLLFEKGNATILFGVALSNRFLRKHAPSIIPDHWPRMHDPSDRFAGSAVEAAVGLIHQTRTVPDANGAIEDLANYLLNAAKMEIPLFNAKGQLLAMGAEFTTQEIATDVTHKPRFRATVQWKSYCVHFEASRKTLAEEMAARKLLVQHDESLYIPKVRTSFPMDDGDSDDTDDGDPAIAPSSVRSKSGPNDMHGNRKPEWTTFKFNNTDFSLRINESKEEWWRRGVGKHNDVFRRVLLTHHVFPQQVQQIRSWSCQWKKQCLVIIALQQCNGTVHSFLGSGKSRSKARAAAATKTAALVQQQLISPNP